MRIESSTARTNYLEEYRASAQKREEGLEVKRQQEELAQKMIDSQRIQAAQEPNKGFSVDRYV